MECNLNFDSLSHRRTQHFQSLSTTFCVLPHFPLLTRLFIQSKPYFGVGVGVGGSAEESAQQISGRGKAPMAGWRTMDTKQHPREYAMRVCKELGWPYEGNLKLLTDCVESLAFSAQVDTWGGFVLLMEAVENAKAQRIRVDRWFFQDGRYTEILPAKLSAARKPPTSEEESSPAAAEIKAWLLRKPN